MEIPTTQEGKGVPKRKFKKEEGFDPFAWWERKKRPYQQTWCGLKSRRRGLKAAKDEYTYRSGELDKTVGRTTLFAAIATAAIAAHIVLFQMGGNIVAMVVGKISLIITTIGPVLLLWSYLPRWRSFKDRKAGKAKFISAEVWTQLIQTPFDEYVLYLMRTERKTRPLDRYKDLLIIVCAALMIGLILLVLAFVLR